MRAFIIPFSIWAAALQVSSAFQSIPTLLSTAIMLTVITKTAYHFGVWRQQAVHLKDRVESGQARQREELNRELALVRQQVAGFTRFIDADTDHRIAMAKWQANAFAMIVAVEKRVDGLDEIVDELAYARTREAA